MSMSLSPEAALTDHQQSLRARIWDRAGILNEVLAKTREWETPAEHAVRVERCKGYLRGLYDAALTIGAVDLGEGEGEWVP